MSTYDFILEKVVFKRMFFTHMKLRKSSIDFFILSKLENSVNPLNIEVTKYLNTN